MKRYISYFAVLLAVLLGAACSKDDSAAGSDNRTGVMAMTVSTRQTADTGEYDPLQHQTVYIYNDEGGLLRKYTSKEACPERLELLAGTYRVAVEAGEEAPADFTKRLYKGEETFTVKPGETTNVAVVCQIVNTVVEVKFDDSILQNLSPGYSVWIAGGEKVDEEAAEAGSVPALRFTTEGTGYYTLPAGMTSLAWLFRGTHVEGKNVEMEDYIPNVKAGGKYTLTFKYSPDLPGFIDCVLISVDPDTDDKDDEIIFSPDPAVISEGFDITEIQKYRSGEKKYRIMAFSELTRFTVSVGDKSYDALNGTTEGISLEPVDKVRTSGDICPYIKKGDPDMARIFVAIVDWNAPHEVVSGMTTTKGAWDPEKGIDNVSEGKILGYGSLWITQSTEGEDMQDAELDIVWYDHETRPAEGKYSLVISCACNAYGDYFTGCSKNVMYVDDFEWVY